MTTDSNAPQQPRPVPKNRVIDFPTSFSELDKLLANVETGVGLNLQENLAQWEAGTWTEHDDHLFNGFTSFVAHCIDELLPLRPINLWLSGLAVAVQRSEERAKRRVHKGSPYYNTALCFFIAGDFDHAYQYMAAADEENKRSGADASNSLLVGDGLSEQILIRPMAAWLGAKCGGEYNGTSGHDLDAPELKQLLRWLSTRMPDALQCVVTLHRLVKVQLPPQNDASRHIHVRALAELCVVLESATRRWNTGCTGELHNQLETALRPNAAALGEFQRLNVAFKNTYPPPSNKSPVAVNWAVKECLKSIDTSSQLSERAGAAMYLVVRLRNSLLHVLEESLDLYQDRALLLRCVGVVFGAVRLSQRGADGTLGAL